MATCFIHLTTSKLVKKLINTNFIGPYWFFLIIVSTTCQVEYPVNYLDGYTGCYVLVLSTCADEMSTEENISEFTFDKNCEKAPSYSSLPKFYDGIVYLSEKRVQFLE